VIKEEGGVLWEVEEGGKGVRQILATKGWGGGEGGLC